MKEMQKHYCHIAILLAANAIAWPPMAIAVDLANGTVPYSQSSVGEMIVYLMIVIALIIVCGALLKKYNTITGLSSNASIKIAGITSLGARERLALVEAAGVTLLIGFGPGFISTLCVINKDADGEVKHDKTVLRTEAKIRR
jgi:flagellar biogenesis protein FliO